MRSSLLYNDEGRRDICHEGFRNEILPGKAGLITEWTTWQKGLSTNGATTLSDTYAYSYDKAGRLLGSVRYSGSSATPLSTLTESGISYDPSGNLTAIKRYGESSGTEPVDDLAFSYTGTKRTGYSYDERGNVTTDPTSGTAIQWNILGLPRTISDGTDTARRVYAADGTLLAVYEGTAGTAGRVYAGSMVQGRAANGKMALEDAGWEGGRILPVTTIGNNADKVLYQITDHLGSVRAVRDGAGTVRQRFDYYPFGSVSRFWNDTPVEVSDSGVVVIDPIIDPVVPGNGLNGGLVPGIEDLIPVVVEETPQSALRYRFGGKEIAGQKVGASAVLSAPAGTPAAAAGRPYLDFGARLYDPRTAAWLAPGPLSEKYYPISPYAYCAGNPVNLVDPDGKNPFLLGVISGAADFGLQIGVYMLNGASFNDAFKQVDWTSVAASAAIGAVNPSTTVRKIATALAITAIDAAADYTEDKGWKIIGQQGKDRKDIGDAAIDFATGAISGSAGSLIPDKIASGLSKEASNRSIMAPLTAAEKAEKRAIAHTANNEYVKEAEGLLLESFIQGTKQSLRIDFNEKTKENENKEYQVKFGTWR